MVKTHGPTKITAPVRDLDRPTGRAPLDGPVTTEEAPARTLFRDLVGLLGRLVVGGGTLMLVVGALYCAAGWRYGVFVLIWAAQWGLPMVGLGMGAAYFGRLVVGTVALLAGAVGIFLVAFGESTHAYGSYFATLVIDGASILVGGASVVTRLRRSL